jgi:predicted GNAT family N-acyltransferase
MLCGQPQRGISIRQGNVKINVNDYAFEPLGKQDLAAFSCNKKALEHYLRKYACQDVRRRLAAVFVLLRKSEPKKVIGYYSLSNSSLRLDQLPPDLAKKAGKYNTLSVTLLGRMAVDDACKGQGIGEMLLLEALHQAVTASRRVASFAVFTEAKDDEAASFYRKYGFIELPEDKLELFLPMKTIEKLFPSPQ